MVGTFGGSRKNDPFDDINFEINYMIININNIKHFRCIQVGKMPYKNRF